MGFCSACGHDNDNGNNFCEECGELLQEDTRLEASGSTEPSAKCPICQATLDFIAGGCPSCGASTADLEELQRLINAKAVLELERQQLVIEQKIASITGGLSGGLSRSGSLGAAVPVVNLAAGQDPGVSGSLSSASRSVRMGTAALPEVSLEVRPDPGAYGSLSGALGSARLSEVAVPEYVAPSRRQSAPTASFDGIVLHLPKGLIMELVRCPAGSFAMGSPQTELGRFKILGLFTNEHMHQVSLTSDFYMARYAVTQEQYEAVMSGNPSRFTGDKTRPVDSVTWQNAMEFCKQLNDRCGLEIPADYRISLPTEAQWEYACRAGSVTGFNNGTELTSKRGSCANLDKLAWYKGNSEKITHPVGQKLPNAWGLYDMLGNVSEWCSDRYKVALGDATDPNGSVIGMCRAARGGSWLNNAVRCRSAARYGFEPRRSIAQLGFRVAIIPKLKGFFRWLWA